MTKDLSWDFERELELADDYSENQSVSVTKRDSFGDIFFLSVSSPRPVDEYGMEYEMNEECVVLTRSEMRHLINILEDALLHI